MNNPWIFDEEQLLRTPSLRDGIDKAIEDRFRVEGCTFIQRLGLDELKLHNSTVATGLVFFHRFYMFQSFKLFPVYPMAATCLFLAGKVEETPKKSYDIIKYSKSILSEQLFAQFGSDPKEEILTLERILLQTLRFDLEIEHPYEHLIKYVKTFRVRRLEAEGPEDLALLEKELLQSAWTLLNDSYHTTICLQIEPEIIAIAMILFAIKTLKFEVTDWDDRKPSHRNWWDVFVENLDEIVIENICHQLLDFYEKQKRELEMLQNVVAR